MRTELLKGVPHDPEAIKLLNISRVADAGIIVMNYDGTQIPAIGDRTYSYLHFCPYFLNGKRKINFVTKNRFPSQFKVDDCSF